MMAAERISRPAGHEGTVRAEALLLRLATEPRPLAAERSALPEAAAARLVVLLREIDGIVLPRRLHVKSGPRELARLTVSHRRLISIEMPGRPTPAPETTDLAGAFAARLVEIAEWRGDLALSVSRRSASPCRAEVACSVAALRQVLDVALTESAFDRLLRLVDGQALARLRWTAKGAQVQFSGTPALRTTLHAIASNCMKMWAQSRADARTGPVRTEGLFLPLEDDLGIVVASLQKQGFAAILPRKSGLDLISAWQSRR